MNYQKLLVLLVVISWATTICAESPSIIVQNIGKTINISRVGSLAKSHDLPCISLSEAKNTYTPPDLYSSSARCMVEGCNTDAAQIFMMANIYGRYDGMRVSDRTAAQANQMLVMTIIRPVDANLKAGPQEEMDKVRAGQSPEIDQLCEGIKAVGKPDYHPNYMILHGMDAFKGVGGTIEFDASNSTIKSAPTFDQSLSVEGDGLIPDYDPDANWTQLIAPLNCP